MPTPVPEQYTITPTLYPAKTHSTTATIKGIETTATRVSFADKILITISQNGRLAHWVHVPLDIAATDHSLSQTSYHDSFSSDPYQDPSSSPTNEQPLDSSLLPHHHLTATTILGGTLPHLDTLGQTLATQIASLIMTRNPSEKRMVVVGMGLDRGMLEGLGTGGGREEFGELVGLVMGVL